MGPPGRGRGEDDSVSVMSSTPSTEEVEHMEDEGNASDPLVAEEDPTDDLK